jgi:hypothetical protein
MLNSRDWYILISITSILLLFLMQFGTNYNLGVVDHAYKQWFSTDFERNRGIWKITNEVIIMRHGYPMDLKTWIFMKILQLYSGWVTLF